MTEGVEALGFGKLSMLDMLGTEIELFVAGTGPAIYFLHGLDGIEGAAPMLERLAKDFTVYAPSHPGFGASALPEGIDRADDLGYVHLDLLDALGLAAPIVAGVSFGAWVAAEMLTKDPARAKRLVLASPLGLPTADRRECFVADIFTLSRQELGRRMQVAPPGPESDMAQLTRLPEQRIQRLMRNDEAASHFGWSPYMSNPKLARRLHRIAAPTMVIWGAEDQIVSPAYRDAWRAALPQSTVDTIAAAGHRIHADRPDLLAARIAGAPVRSDGDALHPEADAAHPPLHAAAR